MKKINLANVEEFKEYSNPSAGGYVIGIYAVEDVPEKEYLKLSYDIMEGEFKGYYSKLVKEGHWNSLPVWFVSYADKSLKFYKGNITSFEKSNSGFKMTEDESKLKGKKVGIVLTEEEYVDKNGNVKISLKPYRAHSIDTIKKGYFEVPERKCVSQSTAPTSTFGAFGSQASSVAQVDPFVDVSDEFMNIPDTIEEMPFPEDDAFPDFN
jgi:hypothetical protein